MQRSTKIQQLTTPVSEELTLAQAAPPYIRGLVHHNRCCRPRTLEHLHGDIQAFSTRLLNEAELTKLRALQ